MNRDKLERLRGKWGQVEYPTLERESAPKADVRAAMLSLLDALLEGGEAPDVGAPWGIDKRLTALEVGQRDLEAGLRDKHQRVLALEAKGFEALGQWEALLAHADRLTAIESANLDRAARLVTLQDRWERSKWRFGSGDLLFLLEALLGPPGVGQEYEWVSNEEVGQSSSSMRSGPSGILSHARGATPCRVCGSYVCTGDVDARACEQRAAARQAKA